MAKELRPSQQEMDITQLLTRIKLKAQAVQALTSPQLAKAKSTKMKKNLGSDFEEEYDEWYLRNQRRFYGV